MLQQVSCLRGGGFTNAEALLERAHCGEKRNRISPLETTWRPAGAVSCIESCAVRTLGDQDFANPVAYLSHSDMNSKGIRNLRFGGPTFHDELHMRNSMSAGPSRGSTWRLEAGDVAPPLK